MDCYLYPYPTGNRSQHALKGGGTFCLRGGGRGENVSSWRLGSKHLKRFKKSLELNRCTRPLPLQVYHRDQDCRETLLDHQLSRLEEAQSFPEDRLMKLLMSQALRSVFSGFVSPCHGCGRLCWCSCLCHCCPCMWPSSNIPVSNPNTFTVWPH